MNFRIVLGLAVLLAGCREQETVTITPPIPRVAASVAKYAGESIVGIARAEGSSAPTSGLRIVASEVVAYDEEWAQKESARLNKEAREQGTGMRWHCYQGGACVAEPPSDSEQLRYLRAQVGALMLKMVELESRCAGVKRKP